MTMVFETPKDACYFFGYFDKSPFDGSGNRLLAQRVDFMDRMPDVDDVLEIGWFNWRESNRFVKVAETRAWNWQTGCMAQWLGPGYSDEIVYNDMADGMPRAVKLNVGTGQETWYPTAVGTVDSQGRYVLSVDYGRMQELRDGYGFRSRAPAVSERPAGIWRIDLKANNSGVIVDLETVKHYEPLSSMSTPHHMLDNPIFSPSGDRVAFFHRWRLSDGAFHTRLYVANADGSGLKLLHDTGRVSHINWRNDCELIAFLGWETSINKLRKKPNFTKFVLRPLLPVYHLLVGNHWQVSQKIKGDSYALVNADTGEARKLAAEQLSRDGHPSFAPNRQDWMLTDTYPDWRQRARLLLYSVPDGEVMEIDTIQSVGEYDDTELRCDLHPRWSRDGSHVCIDHMENGKRGMRVYDLTGIIGGSEGRAPSSVSIGLNN